MTKQLPIPLGLWLFYIQSKKISHWNLFWLQSSSRPWRHIHIDQYFPVLRWTRGQRFSCKTISSPPLVVNSTLTSPACRAASKIWATSLGFWDFSLTSAQDVCTCFDCLSMFKSEIWIHQKWHCKTTVYNRNRKYEDDLQTVDAPRWRSTTIITVELSDLRCQVRQDTESRIGNQICANLPAHWYPLFRQWPRSSKKTEVETCRNHTVLASIAGPSLCGEPL